MFSSHRINFFVATTLTAVLGVTSTSIRAVAATSKERPPALVGETSAHFQLVLRLHPNEARHRQAQLDAVVAAWRAAPRSAANDEQLMKWLRSAIRMSMPGQRETLPPIPDFKLADVPSPKAVETLKKPANEPTLAVPTHVAEPLPAKTVTVEAAAPVATEPTKAPMSNDEKTDPFRDDQADEEHTLDLLGPWTEIAK